MDMTSGKVHEINWAKTIKLPKESFVCLDRGCTDYAWYLLKRAGRKNPGITNNQTIRLKGVKEPLRLVACTDAETGAAYRFVTNAHHLKAKEIP